MLSVFAAALAGFTLAAQTPRADYYTLNKSLRIDVKSCESFLERSETKLGVRVPRFEYYRVTDANDVFRLSPMNLYTHGYANVDPLYVVSTEPCYTHEIAHLLLYQLGRPSHVFEEGMAAYLADDYGLNDRFDGMHYAKQMKLRYGPMNRLFVRYSGRDAYRIHIQYIISQEFVRALVRKAGLEAMRRYFSDPRDATFAALYGASQQEAFDRWLYGKAVP